MEKNRYRKLKSGHFFFCFSFFFLSVCALFGIISTATKYQKDNKYLSAGQSAGDILLQEISRRKNDEVENQQVQQLSLNFARRLLSGPGSSPPRCNSKCGNCTPCKPVHVPVPPGTPVIAEYYPEAWRCKCGNKLYMP